MVFLGAQGSWPLKHVVLHSPPGFEFGYGGSGPADLALSILADWFGEQDAPEAQGKVGGCWRPASHPDLDEWVPLRSNQLHQLFKWDLIANRARNEPFEITEEQIRQWVAAREADTA